jgi:hypothetical protein
LVVALLLAVSATASAAPLIVGGTAFPVAGEPDPVGGTAPAGFPDLIDVPFTGFGFTGKLTSTIRQGTSSNPNGWTFTYLLKNDASSSHVLHRFTVASFDSTPAITTDVSYQTTSTGVIPTLADRSTAAVVGFSFADVIPGVPQTQGNIPAGGQSRLLVIETNATNAAESFASIINGTVATARTYAPVTQIPEPSTCILGALGLVGLVGFARRFRK